VRAREDEVFAAAPLILKSLNELDASPGLGDCTNIVGGVVKPAVATLAAPLTLKSLKDDAAALILRRIAGLPSRINPFKPS
jgi:hypothetical protein